MIVDACNSPVTFSVLLDAINTSIIAGHEFPTDLKTATDGGYSAVNDDYNHDNYSTPVMNMSVPSTTIMMTSCRRVKRPT